MEYPGFWLFLGSCGKTLTESNLVEGESLFSFQVMILHQAKPGQKLGVGTETRARGEYFLLASFQLCTQPRPSCPRVALPTVGGSSCIN